jgi:DNA-binding NarL/FixJ family response regulator
MSVTSQSTRHQSGLDRRDCLTWTSHSRGAVGVEPEVLKMPTVTQRGRQTRLISARDLLILQLADRGYSSAQIAELVGSTAPTILASLAAIATRMGVGTDWRLAIEIARQRDLIT